MTAETELAEARKQLAELEQRSKDLSWQVTTMQRLAGKVIIVIIIIIIVMCRSRSSTFATATPPLLSADALLASASPAASDATGGGAGDCWCSLSLLDVVFVASR